jgi:hypothetical protein
MGGYGQDEDGDRIQLPRPGCKRAYGRAHCPPYYQLALFATLLSRPRPLAVVSSSLPPLQRIQGDSDVVSFMFVFQRSGVGRLWGVV